MNKMKRVGLRTWEYSVSFSFPCLYRQC